VAGSHRPLDMFGCRRLCIPIALPNSTLKAAIKPDSERKSLSGGNIGGAMQKVGGLPTLNGGSDVENDFRDIDGCFRRCDSDLGPRECVFSSPRFPALPKGVQIYLSQPFPQHFVTRLAIALLRDLADRDDLEEFAVGLDTLALDEPEELRPVGAFCSNREGQANRNLSR
jgi:hypothetical protein